MADTAVSRRKGTTGQHAAFTGLLGETTFDTDLNRPVVHDGLLPGGFPVAMLHLPQLFPLSQTLAAEENFFGNTTDPDNAIVFFNPVGVGTNTLDFRTNGTLDANFLRKYNTTPFQIELAASGSLDFVTDSRNVATGTSIRFFTNGIRGSGTQTLLAEFEDNGMVNFTGALSMGTNLINDVLNPVAAQDAATKDYVDGLIAAGAPPFTDSTALVAGSGDPTKLMRFEVDGFTTATTRVLTPPNADITLAGINIAQTFALLQTFSSGIILADATLLSWLTRSVISSPADGQLRLTNNAQTGFTRLQFGGTTAAFPAIGRNGINLEIFGADGAGPSGLQIYNTKTSSTNFERLNIIWATNIAEIFTEKGSVGGTARELQFGTDGVGRLNISPTGTINWGTALIVSQLSTDGSLLINGGALLSVDVTSGFVSIPGMVEIDTVLGALGFFGVGAVVQQDVAPLTNNVGGGGGTPDVIDDFAEDSGVASLGTDLMDQTTVPDKGTLDGILGLIRGDVSQLTAKINGIIDILENYGLLIP